MKQIRVIVVAAISVVGWATVSAVLAESPVRNVAVVNAPDVNVANTADVNIVNTPGVTIENGPTNPVPVVMDASIRVPFSAEGRAEIPAKLGNMAVPVTRGLPTSGIMVIEQVSIKATQGSDSSPVALDVLAVLSGNSGGKHFLNLPDVVEYPHLRIVRGSQTVRIYHDLSMGIPVSVNYGRSPAAESANVIVNLSGYILPTGSPSLAP